MSDCGGKMGKKTKNRFTLHQDTKATHQLLRDQGEGRNHPQIVKCNNYIQPTI